MRNWKNISPKTLAGEKWKPIIGYEGLYEVSNLGRVKHLKTKNCLKERVLRQCFSARYCRVKLSKNAIKLTKSVHLFVAAVFIKNPNNLPQVCHDDDDPTNNAASNLWWGTQSDNIKECHRKGRAANNLPKLSGKNHPMFGKKMSYEVKKKMSDTKKKITDEQIESATKMHKNGESLRKSAEYNGISVAYLSQIINGGYKRL